MFRANGFSLIELLIVIAIIGLIATFSVVAFSSAQQKARATSVVDTFQKLEKALIVLAYDQDISAWWTESGLGGSSNPTFTQILAAQSGMSTILGTAPSYDSVEYRYDNDGDTFDPDGDGCGSPTAGVEVYIPLPSTYATLKADVDEIVDGSDGAGCGRITYSSTNLLYKIGNNSSDLP